MWNNGLIYFVSLCFGANCFGLSEYGFTKNGTWDDVIVKDGYQLNTTSHSVVECGILCTLTAGCQSYFFIGSLESCILFGFVLASSTCAETELGARYYHLDGSTPDPSQTCGGVPATTDCDSTDDTVYRTVSLSDATSFTYRIYRQATTQTTAKTSCNNEGSRLVQVLTVPKMEFLRQMIVNCSDYSTFSFWIDGSNAAASDFNDITQWTTATGQSLPSTTDFWVDGHPNSPMNDHCVPIWQPLNHYWTDRPCSDVLPYICEQTNN